MPILAVSCEDDARIADYRNVPDARLLRERGLFVAEGRLVVRRLLATSRFKARSVLVTPTALVSMEDALVSAADLPVYVVPQAVMDTITGFHIHRGCLALGDRGADPGVGALAEQARRLVVLERVANADNVGGVFRNAAAFGVDGIVIDPLSTDPLYRKAIRTSVGTALQVPFARATEWPRALHLLREARRTLVALTPARNATPLRDCLPQLRDGRWALLLGHEGEGLTREALDACDIRARIPMAGETDSLNVAAAAAVALYELT